MVFFQSARPLAARCKRFQSSLLPAFPFVLASGYVTRAMFPNEEHDDDEGCKSCKAEKTEWCCAKTKINKTRAQKISAAFCFYNVAAAWLATLSAALCRYFTRKPSRSLVQHFDRVALVFFSSFLSFRRSSKKGTKKKSTCRKYMP